MNPYLLFLFLGQFPRLGLLLTWFYGAPTIFAVTTPLWLIPFGWWFAPRTMIAVWASPLGIPYLIPAMTILDLWEYVKYTLKADEKFKEKGQALIKKLEEMKEEMTDDEED